MASGSEGQLIALMRLTPEQFQAAWRRGRAIQWLGALFAWLLFAGIGALFIARSLASTDVQTSDLSQSEIFSVVAYAVLVLLFVPLLVVFYTWLFMPSKSRWIDSRVLRLAALAGESEQIPAVMDQPPLLTPDELPRDLALFRGLKMMTGMSRILTLLLGFFILLMLGVVVVDLTLFDPTSTPNVTDFFQFIYILALIGRVFSVVDAPGVFTEGWRSFIPTRKARLLAVDEQGITWRARGWRTRTVTLPWHDITTFCVYRQQLKTGTKITYFYLALGERESFAWMMNDHWPSQRRASSNLMCQMVTTYTRKPLLDISKFIEATQQWSPTESQSALTNQSRGFGDVVPYPAQTPQQRFYQEAEFSGAPLRAVRLRPMFYLLNIFLMLAVALGAGGFTVMNRQQQLAYYRALPSRIAIETPIFSDSLTPPDNFWPAQTPDATNPLSLGYANGGYTVAGTDEGHIFDVWVNSIVPLTDMVVAATVREIGTVKNDGVGLIARNWNADAKGDQDMVAFYVSPTQGSWALYHYAPGHANPDDNWQFLDGGDNSDYDKDVIHTGADATNRLLLLLRGNTYLCYINDVFVGRIVDDTLTAKSPKQGYAGLYMNNQAIKGVFNDFAIYPAPPPYQPSLNLPWNR